MALDDDKTILGGDERDSADSLASGTVLGDYRIGDCLGRGAMGEVYEAEQVHLGRRYAVKVLPESLSSDPQFAARFQQEARTLASLDHANIVTVHNAGQAAGHFYLVMERLEPFQASSDPDVVSHILAQVLKGLAYAHNQGIVHRDLKPSNLLQARMIEGQVVPTVKIADFGVARVVGDNYMKTLVQETIAMSRHQATGSQSTGTGSSYVGTIKYMAPEVIEGAEADARSDLYAVGVMAYEWLTGKRPVGRYKDVTQLRPELHPDWNGWLNSLLEADPEDRMEDAEMAYETLPGVANPILNSLRATEKSSPSTADLPQTTARDSAWRVNKEVLAAAFYALKEKPNPQTARDRLLQEGHGAVEADEAIRVVRKALRGARIGGALWTCGKLVLWVAAIVLVAVVMDEGVFLYGLLLVALFSILKNLFALLRIPFARLTVFQHPGELLPALQDYAVPELSTASASAQGRAPPYARTDLPTMDEVAESPNAIYGGPWRRLFAAIVDTFVLYAMAIAATLLIEPEWLNPEVHDPAMAWLALGFVAVSILYYIVFEASAWQGTPGKRLLGLKVTDLSGDRISIARSTGRFFGKYISALLLLWGYIRILFNPKRQGLHDSMAGTLVRRG